MPLFAFEGKQPVIQASAFIAPTAVIIGDVIVEESVVHGATLGEECLIAPWGRPRA